MASPGGRKSIDPDRSTLQFSNQQREAEKYIEQHKLDKMMDKMFNRILTTKPDFPLTQCVEYIWGEMEAHEQQEVKRVWALQKNIPGFWEKK